MSLTINSSNRITGIASGLDTEEIVKGLMQTYQTRLDKHNQQTTRLEWKADAYREINTLVKNFREKYLSMLSDAKMMSSSSYRSMMVSVPESVSAVSISASSSAIAGTYTINEITQLATAPKQSSSDVFIGEKYMSDTTLENLELQNAFQFVGDEISFSINGETFTFAKDTTIAGMMSTINNSDAGVTMRYSSLAKGFTISSDTTGSTSAIEIQNISGNAFSAVDSALGIAEGTYTGTDAECMIEGHIVSQSTNTFSYDGITYTLTEETSTPIEFTVEQDYQGTVDKIKDFIDSYNELIDKLQTKSTEEVYYKYPPLTEAQKDEMDEDEIAQWQEKAMSGVLHGDAYIKSLLTSLRGAFYTAVEGTGMSPADIGLTTISYKDGAKIEVNEEKLLNALKNDPEGVRNVFVQTSDTDTSSEEGLMVRISDALLNYTKQSSDIALDTLDKKIDAAEEKEESIEDYMREREEALWRRFSEMEAALAKLNSMSNWLGSLFTV